MLNRTWRLLILAVVLVLMLWPEMLVRSGLIALLGVLVLLIHELMCTDSCCEPTKMPVKKKKK